MPCNYEFFREGRVVRVDNGLFFLGLARYGLAWGFVTSVDSPRVRSGVSESRNRVLELAKQAESGLVVRVRAEKAVF